jgi:hypothetical protein
MNERVTGLDANPHGSGPSSPLSARWLHSRWIDRRAPFLKSACTKGIDGIISTARRHHDVILVWSAAGRDEVKWFSLAVARRMARVVV